MGWLLSIKCYGNDRGVPRYVCCPKVFSFKDYKWMEHHVISINVLCMLCFVRIKTFTCIVKNRTIHETRCLWSVFKFLWFEDFNLPDVSRQFRLKLALLNETSMCWNVDISRNGCNSGTCTTPGWNKYFYPRQNTRISLSGMQEKVFRDFHQCWQIFSCIPDRNFHEPNWG